MGFKHSGKNSRRARRGGDEAKRGDDEPEIKEDILEVVESDDLDLAELLVSLDSKCVKLLHWLLQTVEILFLLAFLSCLVASP